MTLSWEDSKEQSNVGGQRREIVRTKYNEGPNKRRLIGGVLPRYLYWITTKEGKRVPVECLSFDRDSQTMNDNADDPIKELPDEVFGGEKPKPAFAYVCNMINKDCKPGEETIELNDLKATIYKEIVNLIKDPEWGNPADIENGYDLVITKEKTGPLPQNVKYSVRPGRSNRPLTDHEKSLELYDLEKMLKRNTYEEQKKWLLENTHFYDSDEGSEFKPESAEDL